MKPKLVYLNIVFSVTLVVLLTLSAIFIKRMGDISVAEEMVAHTNKVINHTDLIKNNLNEAESAARGFLLTGDNNFLVLYNRTAPAVPVLIDSLKRFTSDNEVQQKNLAKLQVWVDVRLSYLKRGLAIKNDSALLRMQMLVGKNAMDTCLSIFALVKSEEQLLLDNRNKNKVFYLNAAPRTFQLIFIFTLLVFIISFLFMARELRLRAGYQKNLERKLLELNRTNSDLQEFSFIASHNLQEPLRKIRVFSDRLNAKHKDQLNDEARQIVIRMGAAASTMHELINDFINFINLHNTKEALSLVEFNNIIEMVSSEIKSNTPGAAFTLKVAALGNLQGYAHQLRLLFKCLLENSLKFSREGVPLEISISGEVIDWNDMWEINNNMIQCPYYKLTIADNGKGFDNVFSKKIFKLFQRLDNDEKLNSARGTGLAIVEHVMINHHGFVTATGVVNAGAKFSLFFPMEK